MKCIGGPAFIAPLLAGDVLPPLLETLQPSETPPKLVNATLRALNQIVDAVAQEKPWLDMSESSFRSSLANTVNESIYTKAVIDSLAEILSQSPGTTSGNQQIEFAVQLIRKTCVTAAEKKMLVEAGILDLVADKLAGMAAADENIPSAADAKRSKRDQLPRAHLPILLETVSTIIKDSHFYTARFIYSQSIQQLFGWPKERMNATYEGNDSSSPIASWDKLIPRVQTITNKSDPYTKSWPALGAHNSAVTDGFTRLPSFESLSHQMPSRSVITDESESPLFIWLMYVARRGEGRERLSACWLLALLKKFGDRWPLNDPSKVTRERHFSYLIIPLVEKMIEEANPTSEQAKKAALSPTAKEEMRFVLERSPLVLAELVSGNKSLQTAAVHTRTLPMLIQILKKSFDLPTTSSKPLWQPRSASLEVKNSSIDPASSTLGKPGLSADILHAFKYRESALLALAAIAGDQDMLRKLVIEMGAATHIIEALVPYKESSEQGASVSPKDGNPDAVLIAACKVTRSLSRSVSVLRTSLIDHGVAQPIFELLTHSSVDVQIAATEVITNLVLEMSPMRTVSAKFGFATMGLTAYQEIIESGVLKTLCEQCRSANFDLRFGSLWALKHLCLGLPHTMKIQCLEELGVGWLVQVLNGEPSKPTMGTPNAAGEQVDILNAVDEPEMDVDEEPSSEEDDEDAMTESIPSMRRHQRPGSRYTSATNIRDRLQQIRNDEQDGRLNGERDDIRIQEQALDFIRNFLSEEKASGEMIDHLLKTFGSSRFFELLDAKIRPKNSLATNMQQGQASPSTPSYWPNPTHRTSFPSTTNTLAQPNWATYPAMELILATVFILVHLANGRPAHRSLLIAQTGLMQHVLPLFTHPRREIRSACAWVLHNLVWVEDHTDEAATRDRCIALRQMGFEEGAKVLGRDLDNDVKERAKTSITQFSKLLGDGQGRSGFASPAQGFAGEAGLGVMGGRLGGLHGGWRHDSRG